MVTITNYIKRPKEYEPKKRKPRKKQEARIMRWHIDNPKVPDELNIMMTNRIKKKTNFRLSCPGIKPIEFILKPKK